MTQQIFPNVEELLTLLMDEMPEGVYAEDRADHPNPSNRSFSSAEIRAHAQMIADAYANLKNINKDKFLTTVTTGGVGSWEKDLFKTAQDSNQTFEVRKANLIAKFRASGGINTSAIEDIVDSILTPVGLTFQISTWGCLGKGDGAWVLDESALDVSTYLSLIDPLLGARPDMVPLDCDLDYAAAGLTLQEMQDIQRTAYTYEVRIFGTADSTTLAQLDQALTQFEPARSTHEIRNNFPGPVAP